MPDLLAERVEREGHRQLRADRVAVRPRVRGQQEPLAREDLVADRGHDVGPAGPSVAAVARRSSVLGHRRPGASVSAGGRRARPARALDLLEDPLDAVAALDRLVEEELELGHAAQPQPAADLAAQERRRALERARSSRVRAFVVAERRVVDARDLQVGGDLHAA